METTTYTTANKLTYDHWLACGGHTETYANVYISSNTISEVDTVRRVKPQDYLWRHMTPHGPNWNEQHYAGHIRKVHWYTSTCGVPGGSYPGVEVTNSYPMPDYFPPSSKYPSTNWQLDMRNKIKDLSMNLGETLFEYRESARMFSNLAKGAWSAYRCLRSGGTRCRKLGPCDVSGAWLTTNFGILPLMNDVSGAIEVLRRRLNEPIVRRFAVKKSKVAKFLDDVTVSGYDVAVRWQTSELAIVYIEFRPEIPGLIVGNPAEVLWNLTPFTFVVDWAVPIGDYLSSLDALRYVDRIDGVLVKKHNVSSVLTPTNLTSEETCLVEPKVDTEVWSRGTLTDIPYAQFPSYSPSRSWKAVVHGLSLLHQIRRC